MSRLVTSACSLYHNSPETFPVNPPVCLRACIMNHNTVHTKYSTLVFQHYCMINYTFVFTV